MFLNEKGRIEWKKAALGVAVAIGSAIIGFSGADMFIQPYFRELDGAIWQYISIFGSWKIIAVLALAVFAITRFARKFPAIERLSLNIFFSVMAAHCAVGILKICVGRMRPLMFEALALTGFSPFSLSDTYHSFPSGHAAAAFAFFVSIGLANPKYKPLTWILAILVSAARLAMGAHWPADVIVGAFIGMLAADLAAHLRQTQFVKRMGI